jgi:hypothetical protein|tara:strand:- start:70 stop:621 length:552 start_codon:yes stop_codon:yes gene_type:complete
MGTIRKDFKYKIVKNFLTKDEVKLFTHYCEIKHRTNTDSFDRGKNADTQYYGDAIMESLLLSKQKKLEKETNKKLLPTYAFWRMYTRFSELSEHKDRAACEISVTVHIGSDGTEWPFYVEKEKIISQPGDGVIYLGCDLKHSRDEFQGDWHAQTFLHYVDAEGPNKDHHMDKRAYWNTQNKIR